MATEVIKDVGGGANHYANFTSWEDGEDGANLPSLDEIRTGNFFAINDNSGRTILDGNVTDPTRYWKVTVDASARHNGTYTTSGAYRFEEATNGECVSIRDDHARFYWAQFKVSGTAGVTFDAFSFLSITSGANQYYIENCIFVGSFGGSADCQALYASGTNANINVSNCLFTDWVRGTSSSYVMLNGGTGVVRFYNCTMINCWRALRNGSSGSMVAKNVIASGADTGSVFISVTADYCVTNDGSTSGGTGNKTGTPTYIGAPNYHLADADTVARRSGTDLSGDASYPISIDIDGTTRTGTWDIGMDQDADDGGGGSTGTKIIPERIGLHALSGVW